jgi:NHL repeat
MNAAQRAASVKLMAILVLCLVAGGLYVSIWADERAEEIEGPTLMRADARQNIWVHVQPMLYGFDGAGNRLGEIRLTKLAVHFPIGDFMMDSSGDLILAVMETQEVQRFDPAGHRKLKFAIKKIEPGRYQGALKVVPDPHGSDYYVADTLEHRILRFDAEGHLKGGFGQIGGGDGQFHFPNRIAFGPDDRLYVADTNNHRIVVRERNGTVAFSMMTVNTERMPAYRWPTHFDFLKGGDLIVINRGPGLEDGELVIINRDRGIVRTISLPPDTDPDDIVARDEDILVTDRRGMRVIRMAYDGSYLGEFGDPEFLAMLAVRHAGQERYREMASYARWGMGALLVLLLILLVIQRRVESRQAMTGNPLKDRLELRPVTVETISPTRKKIFHAALVAGLSIQVLAMAMLLLHPWGPWNHDHFAMHLAALIAAILGLYMVLLIFMKMIRDGFFRVKQIRQNERVLNRHAKALAAILGPDEKIRLFALARRMPGARESILRGGVFLDFLFIIITVLMKIDMVFLVLTSRRVLFLQTDLFGARLRRVREASYTSIREVATEPPSKIHRFTKRIGTGFLALVLTGNDGPMVFQVPWDRLAMDIKSEIEERKQEVHADFNGLRDICMGCHNSLLPKQTVCPKCHRPVRSRWRAAVLSMLYPGLGQLENQNLLKGTVFLTVFTFVLLGLAIQLLIAWQGTAEVNPTVIEWNLTLALTVWISSSADAYYSSP